MGEGLNRWESSQALVLILAMILGLAAGTLFGGIWGSSNDIIYVSLILLVYGIALGTPLSDVARSYRNRRFFAIALLDNFVVIPIIGFILALGFLYSTPLIYVGFILYVVNPCTDWFLVFTGMAKGDVPLGLALLPINLIVQILLIPVFLLLFAGQLIPIPLSAFVETSVVFIAIPFIGAMFTNWAAIRRKGMEWKERRMAKVPIQIQTITLAVIIFFMFAGQTQVITQNLLALSVVLVPVAIFIVVSFFIARAIGIWAKLNYEEYALLSCTTIARNSPLALAISYGLFPGEPLIQVSIIIGVLIELPALVLLVKVLRKGQSGYSCRVQKTVSVEKSEMVAK
jgi:ACR3 family arsenite efflux pump ArsB